MKRTIYLWLLLFSVCSTAFAQSNVDVPAGVTVIPNVSYISGGTSSQVLDFYLPAGYDSNKSYPVILAVHGGGWFMGDKAFQYHYMLSNTLGALLNTGGYIVASANYTLTTATANPYPTAVNELNQAVDYLKTVTAAGGQTINIDSTKIGAFGGSAGGNLVEMLGAQNTVSAVASFCGEADLRLFLNADGSFKPGVPDYNKWYFGMPTGEATIAKAIQASPITYIDGNDSAFLLVHGTADTTVPYENSVLLNDAVKAAGGQSSLITLEGTNHDGPAFVSSSTLNAVVQFFDQTLRGIEPGIDLGTFRFKPDTTTADYSLGSNWEQGAAPGQGDSAVIDAGTNNITLMRVANQQNLLITGNSQTTVGSGGTYVDSGARVVIEDATLTSQLCVVISETSGDAEVVIGQGGVLNANSWGLHLGAVKDKTGRLTINTGGTVNSATYLRVGSQNNGIAGNGELTLNGGTLNITSSDDLSIGYAAGSVGKMTVNESSTVSTKGNALIGHSGTGELTVNGGKVEIKGSIAYVGTELNSTGTVNVNGGLLKMNYYALIGSRGDGTVNLNSGTITTGANFNIGIYRGGTGQVFVRGGTLTAQDIHVGLGEAVGDASLTAAKGQLTLMGDSTVQASGTLYVSYGEGTGTFNLVGQTQGAANGNGLKWQANNLNVHEGGTVNFLADASGLPTLTVTDNATVGAGSYNVGIYGGVAAIKQTSDAVLLDAGTLSGWNASNLKNSGLWTITQSGADLIAALNSSLKMGTVNTDFQMEFDVPSSTGFLELEANADSLVNIELTLSGDGSVSDLAKWMSEQFRMNPRLSDTTVLGTDHSIIIKSLNLDGANIIGWDFSLYNAERSTSFAVKSAASVPEPSSWSLLILGAAGLAVLRKRRG